MYGGGLGQEESEKREMEHSLTFSMLGVRDAHNINSFLNLREMAKYFCIFFFTKGC